MPLLRSCFNKGRQNDSSFAPKFINRTLVADNADWGNLFSCNKTKFKMDIGALGGLIIDDITANTIPKDFARSLRIHSCWLIRRPR